MVKYLFKVDSLEPLDTYTSARLALASYGYPIDISRGDSNTTWHYECPKLLNGRIVKALSRNGIECILED